MRVTYDNIAIPDFGGPEEIPSIPRGVYSDRLLRLQDRMKSAGLDVLVVYADREHSANMAYLTGFDPRFEEALFIFLADGQRTLIVGNECRGVLGRLPIQTEILLCQEFSLMGQDRSISWDLKVLLRPSGVRSGARCGMIGWKTLREGRIEVPHYVVRLVEEACGQPLINANDLLMDAENGMRLFNEPEQIAFYEYAAVRTSESVRALLRGLRPGVRAFDAARLFDSGGLPLSCHPMLAFGPDIPNGMASPSNDRLAEGDHLTCAFGVWGSLTCRAGLAIRDAKGLKTSDGEAHWKVIENYLRVTRAWYRSVCVGMPACQVWRVVEEERDNGLYTFCVNPGHYIHLDEWLSSPFYRESTAKLPSASALQVDIIPVGRAASINVNMEDGIVLADSALRRELVTRYPDLYARCAARRQFMQEVLGYELSEDILPLGNIPGAYFPFLLDTGWVCRFEK